MSELVFNYKINGKYVGQGTEAQKQATIDRALRDGVLTEEDLSGVVEMRYAGFSVEEVR
jgi:hypothetical protein